MKTYITSAIITATFLLSSCATTGGAGIKRYTSDTCVVTDNKLGSMGSPISKVYGNQEVKFCCKPCIEKYEKNPQKFAANIR
ncbi:MAG TPA: hypothetical protein DDW21_04840 [Verrucomicrobiales bacterium]|jgi:hypothetical protein|nr:MAG: hypothetical protein B9S37_06170 [Verrucomicrobiae bacterium Tous-C3TDCM]PAZ04177.1 MAG: hypothetical protein CAK88_12340 [Verrucomicrobiae bacterium AMD-G2]HBE22762.1 hypothetical protein [Verrucomicrobiales bacterium]